MLSIKRYGDWLASMESSTCAMARYLALGRRLSCSSCCCNFGAGPRLLALRGAGMPIKSSIDTPSVRASSGRVGQTLILAQQKRGKKRGQVHFSG